jgi:hypothetical protein
LNTIRFGNFLWSSLAKPSWSLYLLATTCAAVASDELKRGEGDAKMKIEHDDEDLMLGAEVISFK